MKPNLPPLPRFTLLHCPRPACLAFSEQLCLVYEPDIFTLDFENTLLDSLLDTFFEEDRYGLKRNFNDPTTWLQSLPHSDNKLNLDQFITLHKEFLRSTLSRDILGRIFIRHYLTDNYEEFCPHILIRDFDERADLDPLVAHYGRSSHCTLNLGPLTDKFPMPPGHVMWLSSSDPKQQVAHYLIELEQRQQRLGAA